MSAAAAKTVKNLFIRGFPSRNGETIGSSLGCRASPVDLRAATPPSTFASQSTVSVTHEATIWRTSWRRVLQRRNAAAQCDAATPMRRPGLLR
jgi:hypothetical protein